MGGGNLLGKLLSATSLMGVQCFAPDGVSSAPSGAKVPTNPRYAALEPRVLFDAAGAATWADAADTAHVADAHDAPDHDPLIAALTDVPPVLPDFTAQPVPVEIAFVDAGVEDFDVIVSDFGPGVEVHIISSDSDGVAQIADILQGRTDIGALHIVSHGSAGQLLLGSAALTASSIVGVHADELSAIRSALSQDADILIYGCDFAAGETGRAAVQALADMTGADVAASDDATGAADLGGDWVLEDRVGAIEARSLAATDYQHTLVAINTVDAFVVNGSASNVSTSQIQLTANANNLVGSAMSKVRIDFSQDFTFDYDLNFGTNDANGADGIAFVFHNDPAGKNVTGQAGGALGIGGIQNSIAIKFDTFDNSAWYQAASLPSGELAQDFAVILDPGSGFQLFGAYFGTNLTAPVALNGGANIENGAWHPVHISWNATSKTLAYSFDGNPVQSITRDIVANDLGSNYGYFGFAASTGGFTNQQQLRNLNIVGSIPPVIDLDNNNSSGAAGFDYKGTFTENGSSVALVDTDVTVTDVVSATLVSAEVRLTNAKVGDVLTIGALPGTITATVNTSIAGVITVDLTGTGTIAEYHAALQAIKFSTSGTTVDTTARNVEVTVNDGSSLSNTAISTINVLAVNHRPDLVLPTSLSATEDLPLALTGITFSDVDAGSGNVTATFAVTSGAISATSGSGVTVGGTATSRTLTGTLSAVNAFVAAGSVTYLSTSETAVADVLTVTINDNGNTGIDPGTSGTGSNEIRTATVNIAIALINDPPVNTLPASYSTAEDTTLALTGLSVADNDAGTGVISVTLAVTGGTITSPGNGVAVTTSGSGTSSLVLTGTLANINALLANAAQRPQFVPTPDFNGTVTLTMTTNDNGNTGPDGAKTDVDTRVITVTPVADIVADSVTTLEDTAVTVSVLATDNFENAGRTITAIGGTPVLVGQTVNVPNGTAKLNAGGTITFTPSSDYNGTATFSYTVTSGGVTETANVTVTITAVPDGPRIDLDVSAPGFNFTTNTAQLALGIPIRDVDFSVTDPEGDNLVSMKISITDVAVGDVLSLAGTLPAGITASAYNPATGTIDFTGNATLANYQTALGLIRFATSNVDDGGRLIVVSANSALAPLPSNSAIAIINIAPADTDHDGIFNDADVDDDNDGMLDTVEGTTLDSDNDGLADYLDIDSDDDGITDNIEAQTTTGYIAPSGVDADLDGLDDAYGAGFTPVNTDGADAADYLDTDSDNDGLTDVQENGLGIAQPLASALDTDGDGLKDVFEAAIDGNINDGPVVNEGKTPLPASKTGYLNDSDQDAALGVAMLSDLNFRDGRDDTDTDKDGVIDLIDIDDDNDGILDRREQTITVSAPTNIVTSGGFNGLPTAAVSSVTGWTLNNGQVFAASTVIQFFQDNADQTLTQTGLTGLAEGPGANGAAQVEVIFAASNSGPSSSAGSGVTFEVIVGGVVYARVTTTDGQGTGTSASTLVYLNGASGTLNGSPTATPNVGGAGFGTLLIDLPADVANTGSIQLHFVASQTTPSDDITIDNVRVLTSTSTVTLRDTDGDGISDHLDIDSDNDGITDNIEAQTTAGYIAPSGVGAGTTDANNDGLDDVYDAGALGAGGGIGLTPVNTDGTDNADFIDLNSDNDALTDNQENGLGVAMVSGLSTALTDADGDGLFDVYETAIDGATNDGFVVNEGQLPLPAATTGYLPDDGDTSTGTLVPMTKDLNYRDAEDDTDTDGDGVVNIVDIDDDNDGILDTVEGHTPVTNALTGEFNGTFGTLASGRRNLTSPVSGYTYTPGSNTAAGHLVSISTATPPVPLTMHSCWSTVPPAKAYSISKRWRWTRMRRFHMVLMPEIGQAMPLCWQVRPTSPSKFMMQPEQRCWHKQQRGPSHKIPVG
jgi:Domain of unknown function (DUF4347)/Bacterial lectin/Bacterial Ig domain